MRRRIPGAIALLLCVATVLVGVASATSREQPSAPEPVPSLDPAATGALWAQLVRTPRRVVPSAGCKPLRAVFYAATDWLRLATTLAASGSPCAEPSISVPPLTADKTKPRPDQAWRIRALGPAFHALAEINFGAWSTWVATGGRTWFEAGVEARTRMAAAGYDVAAGDTWALNEASSAVRRGDGNARANLREFLRGLATGAGGPFVKGVVFVTGISQPTSELSVYQARLQDWYEDAPFWADMSSYVRDWSQELYGDIRNHGVAGATLTQRRDALNAYLQHEISLARAAPAAGSAAAAFLESAYNPLANGAWAWDTGFGWTDVPYAEMQAYVSSQVYALRNFAAVAPLDRFGLAWAPKNLHGLSSSDYVAQTGAILSRLAAALHDSAGPVDPSDAGVGACGPPGDVALCMADRPGAAFNAGWSTFATWKPSVLAILTAPQTVAAGASSAPVTVAYRTATGVSLPAGVPLPVTLSTSSATGGFSTSPSGPWTPTLEVTIPNGSSTVDVRYRDTAAGTPTITAAAAGKASAVQQETITPGAGSLTVSPPSVTLAAGAQQALAATVLDTDGNPLPADAVTWQLSPDGLGALSAATGGTVTFTAGATGGSGTVTASVAGSSGPLSADVPVTVEGPTSPYVPSIDYVSAPRRLTVSFRVVDAAGVPIRRPTVDFTLALDGVPFRTWHKRGNVGGKISVSVGRPPAGCWTTSIAAVDAPGWDGVTPPNELCR